ncbi:MAG: vitamin K epoxide reductase family protein [Micrococcales bacterium]
MSEANASTIREVTPPRSLIYTWIIGAILGWYASFSLVLERIHVAENADALASCDLNPILSCKSVMLSAQAKLFGFPNPIIGLAAFFAPLLVAFAVLAGAKFKTWFWHMYLLGIALGFIFVVWLFTQTVYSIGAICLYCMVAWFGMIPMFWGTLLWLIREDIVEVPTRFVGWADNAYSYAWAYSLITEAIMASLILMHFADRLGVMFSVGF